ncbi:hypothetical protein I302_104700 [Kwoniella bestiolae CBS 10118]|uniref:Uncharacterized protein n=1 Tax=Kwoniella bestiolae CBS 10118 TaxID=1296100 RepID=A0A1B9FS05_9TREE|nr:hypothetical protein I302_09229 [Kwoniella bestiolae CBS 10118]OCF21550.1 hypothetical protein I302_09229 [Kwoniella bestiolae CBS 10118]
MRVLLSSVLLLLGVVAAHPAPVPTPTDTSPPTDGLSNSERLARGLPLNKPKLLYDPARVRAILPRQSSLPPTEPETKPSNPIEAGPVVTQAVKASFYNANTKRDGVDSGDLGYLWGQYAGGGVWALTEDPALAAKFIFQKDATGSNNNILINDTFYNPEYELPHLATGWMNWSAYMNYGYNSPRNNLGGENGNCIGFTRTSYVPPGFAISQTSIWNAPTPGQEMIFEWTNQDGTVVKPNFYLMPEVGYPNIRIAVKGADCGWDESRRIRLVYGD